MSEKEIIHADISESNGEIRGACGLRVTANSKPGHAFVWREAFASYPCGEGESKCAKCADKLAAKGLSK